MTSIDEKEKEVLRHLISLPPEQIESAFAKELSNGRIGAEKFNAMRAFLEDKLVTSPDKYIPRIRIIIELINERGVPPQNSAPTQDSMPIMEGLCERILSLNIEKNRIQDEIDGLKMQLKGYLSEGKTSTPNHTILFYGGYPYLGVTDRTLIPARFLTPQPDGDKMLDYSKSTGEIVPGTEVRQRKDIITIKKRK